MALTVLRRREIGREDGPKNPGLHEGDLSQTDIQGVSMSDIRSFGHKFRDMVEKDASGRNIIGIDVQ